MVYLWGNSGTGKTHLLQAVCRCIAAKGELCAHIPLKKVAEMAPKMLENLEQLSLVGIDDVQAIAGQRQWEEALFHLYNRVYDSGSRMFIGANVNPKELGLGLPDLSSRLAWGAVLHIQPLDDNDKVLALNLHARQRGLQLPENVGWFLLRHCQRDMPSLFSLLDRLDMASLSAQRKLTIPFVKEFI